jgi:hypothetical protein
MLNCRLAIDNCRLNCRLTIADRRIGDWQFQRRLEIELSIGDSTIQPAIGTEIDNRRFVDRQSPIEDSIGNCQSAVGSSGAIG